MGRKGGLLKGYWCRGECNFTVRYAWTYFCQSNLQKSMGYLCTNFLNSTVMCFLRPIVQFELTYVLDCTCLASSVPSLTSHRRMHWHLWTCWDHLQSTLLLSNSGRNEYSWCLLLFCRGESTIILVFSFSCLWRYWIVVVAFSIVLFPFFLVKWLIMSTDLIQEV